MNAPHLLLLIALSTIQNADKIYVLNHGRIVESGDHTSLMEKKGEYMKLYLAGY